MQVDFFKTKQPSDILDGRLPLPYEKFSIPFMIQSNANKKYF